MSLKYLGNLDEWRTKRRSRRSKKKIYIYGRHAVSERNGLKELEKSSKNLTQDLKDASRCSVDPSAVDQSLIRNGLHGSMAVKKPFLRKGKGEKRLSYAQ